MKKTQIGFFLLISFIIALGLFVRPTKISAYTEAEEVCYGQCAAYKFVWQGDFCYDTFLEQCSMGKAGSIKETIKFLKGIYGVLKSGKNVDTVFKAWFMCKPLIEECIVPQLQNCRATCSENQLYYAPDLSVGHPYGNFVYHGVVYNDDYHTLTFKVVNNGRGYAWDIGVSASWGHTRNRDGLVSGGGQLFEETIPEMIYAGARNGPPKTVGDYVKDFLIEETNFAKYLQGFKSDADNYDVPEIWYKTIPFTAPEGELTKVIFNVDPNQMITEYSELNNTFILTIDKLPTPPAYELKDFSQKLVSNTLNNFLIDFSLKNTGEENGQATVKIFEGGYTNSSQTPIYSSSQIVQGLNQFNFSTFITTNNTAADAYCGKNAKYELVVFDGEKKVATHEFWLPLYSGSVSGRVEDLFGKKVVGATVTASSGQSTIVNQSGFYHLKKINQLGKVTLTVTHPEFSQTTTQELNFQIKDPDDPCAENSLSFNAVNFVLKDQDVLFNLTIKDGAGNLVNAHVLASNEAWRFEQDVVASQTPLPGMQPGKYVFTISATGYKTISQTVSAVPNNQNLEFILEKFGGRPTDGGLTIHEPRLLWQMDRGEEILAQMAATKDGKEVILYTVKNKPDTGKLYFLDSLTGKQIKVINNTIATGGQSQSCLDTSYDGNTTALYVHTGTAGMAQDTRNVLKLFNNQGNEIGTTDFKSGGGAHECAVSPDGFYVHPDRLMNKGLYIYTRFDIEGKENRQQAMGYTGTVHFTADNNLIAGCPEGGGLCKQSIYENVITNYGDITSSYREADSSQTGQNFAALTTEKVYLFTGDNKAWEKDVITRGDPLSLSVSPGGKFVIYSTAHETQHPRIFKIFTDNNIDKTMGEVEDSDEDVVFVHANDKGLFIATHHGKILKYYQVGSYSTDYNQPTSIPSVTPEENTTGLSIYFDGQYFPTRSDQSFNNLDEGVIYVANRNINLNMGDTNGSLFILAGSIFSVNANHQPILLKGQMTAEFASPITIYALKFDRFDMTLFQTQLNLFRANRLSEDEYFIVKNIHTKFKLINEANAFKVQVENGQVQVNGQEIDQTVESGKQITIDQNNQVKEASYLGWKVYAIVAGVAAAIAGLLLFIYRQTKIGKKIIALLKFTGRLLGRLLLAIIKLIYLSLKNLLLLIWQLIKFIGRFIIKIVKK